MTDRMRSASGRTWSSTDEFTDEELALLGFTRLNNEEAPDAGQGDEGAIHTP